MSVPGYVPNTFTAGQQPTTSVWNELWANDAAFNAFLTAANITGALIASYSTNRNNNGTNVNEAAAHLESGWVAGQPGAADFINFAVTFPVPFTNVPIVEASFGGDTAATTSTLGSGGSNVKNGIAEVLNVTTTGFTLQILSRDATNWAAGNTVYGHWIAIGN